MQKRRRRLALNIEMFAGRKIRCPTFRLHSAQSKKLSININFRNLLSKSACYDDLPIVASLKQNKFAYNVSSWFCVPEQVTELCCYYTASLFELFFFGRE